MIRSIRISFCGDTEERLAEIECCFDALEFIVEMEEL